MNSKKLIKLAVLLLVFVASCLGYRWLGSSTTYSYRFTNPSIGNDIQLEATESSLLVKEPTNEEKLYTYFEKYNCPLLDKATLFIYVAEKHHLDWRLLPAISMQESSCGKRQLGNNPFGYGYYKFQSFDHAIEYVGSSIAGENPRERSYRNARKNTDKILWLYNGTVNANYPNKIKAIMEEISKEKK